jgi:threonine dehydrogenase-like Zn-dependent dehydrogenase
MRDHAGPRAENEAALFGYSKLYGEVPGGQTEFPRVPQAQYTHIEVPAVRLRDLPEKAGGRGEGPAAALVSAP